MTMKKIIVVLFLLTIGFSCKKEDKKPITPPEPKTSGLFIYRVEGIQTSDTAKMTINDVQSEATYNYHVKLKPGDILSFYYSSNNPNMNFAIWEDYNGPYEVIKFNPIERVSGQNYFIKGTYVVPKLH